jgi:hypothetical protein
MLRRPVERVTAPALTASSYRIIGADAHAAESL